MRAIARSIIVATVMHSAIAWPQNANQAIRYERIRASLGPELFVSYKALISSPAFASQFPDLWYGLIKGWRPPSRHEAITAIVISLIAEKEAIDRVKNGQSTPDTEKFEELRRMAPVQIAMTSNLAKEWAEMTGGEPPTYLMNQINQHLADIDLLLRKTSGQESTSSQRCSDQTLKDVELVRSENPLYNPQFDEPLTRESIGAAVRSTYNCVRMLLFRWLVTSEFPNIRERAGKCSPSLLRLLNQYSSEVVSTPEQLAEMKREIGSWSASNNDLERQLRQIREDESMKSLRLSRDLVTSYWTLWDSVLAEEMRERESLPLFPSWKPPSRYEAALAVHSAFVHLRDRKGDGDFDTLLAILDRGRARDPLKLLISEFAKELRRLEVQTEGLLADLDGWKLESESDHNQYITLEPQNFQIYDSLRVLHERNALVGYPVSGRGLRVPSRYEIAVATHASYVHVRNGIESGNRIDSETLADLCTSPLLMLSKEFVRELRSLGVDVPATLNDLVRLQGGVIANRPYLHRSQDPRVEHLSMSESGEQAMKNLGELLKAGLLENFPIGGHYKPTNYDAAGAIVPTISHATETLKQLSDPKCDVIECAMLATEIGIAMESMPWLVKKFTPELRTMHVDPNRLLAQIREIRELVGASWASDKVARWNASRKAP